MNINTTDSLVNGSLGVVEDIVTDNEGKVKYIVIIFDDEKVGAEQRRRHANIAEKYKEKNGTPIFRQKVKYHLTGSGGKPHAAKATVFQFPLRLAFAMTGHKMQGQTVKKGSKLVVNWCKRMPQALAYMMLSRSESIEDIFIAGNFDPKQIRCNEKALDEANRLEEISLTNLPSIQEELNSWFGFSLLNIRSLKKNLEHLQNDQIMLKEDIIFVTETWKEPESQTNYDIDGYKNVFAHGTPARGKGVGVYFKNDAVIDTCEEELYQLVKYKAPRITVFCLYVSKGCNFHHLVQTLKNFDFNNKDENTCLTGDLNFDANCNNELSRYLSRSGFVQMVGRATHLDGNILDQVYVPEKISRLIEIKHHHVYFSDHDGLLVKFKEDLDKSLASNINYGPTVEH